MQVENRLPDLNVLRKTSEEGHFVSVARASASLGLADGD
jgi:hypothetical protein